MRVAVEKRKLPLWRQKRLVIVRPMKIDQFVAELLENSQRRRRSVDKLAVRAGRRKTAFHDQLAVAALDTGFLQKRIHLFQFRARENRFDDARIRAGPDQRFVRPFAEKQLERANDD